jgi:16S rRNA processing protein RimM
MAEKMFNIGKVINTHGLKGEVKVNRITDFEERFEVGNKVFVAKDNSKPQELEITSHRIHKGFDLLCFEGVDTIEQAEELKGAMLKIGEDQLTELEEGEYYYFEIIGCTVCTVDDQVIGQVKEVLSPGANDVWVVERLEKKDALIPYIDEVVKEVNVEKKKITIQPIEGLLD